jgi:DNA-binding CsgD family transcriptional regulator
MMAQHQKTRHRVFPGDANGRGADHSADGAASNDIGSFVLNGRRFIVYAPETGGEHEHPPAHSGDMLLLDGRRCRIVEQVKHSDPDRRDPAEVLTARELQVATLVAHGHGTKRIADRLCISEWTVQTHLRRIYAKLGVAGRAEMVFRCARRLVM